MSIAQALRAATERLSVTSGTARLDAELLMAHCLKVSRSDLLLRHMDDDEPEGFAALVDRRAAHEPVAYLLGEQEFFGRTFTVAPGVLIPRGDSEVLIEAALEKKPDAKSVLDLGTGSGALLLTFLAESRAQGVGLDASPQALQIARQNVEQLGLQSRAQMQLGDWREPGWADGLGQFDLVLCNPPYVERDAELDRDVADYEPASALFAGVDGLDDYTILIPQIRSLLSQGGVAIFEIGATQDDDVGRLAEKAGFAVELRHDLANRPRALILS